MPKYRILTIGPIVVLPLLLIEPAIAGRCAWATAVIAILWATEALPIAVTSLLPLVLFPLLGVAPAERMSRNYFADKIVLFFGGLVVACALKAVALHRRMALRVLLLFGSRPPWLLLGFMSSTAFLSMWMSNTATAAMMMPIAEAVITQLEAAPAGTNSRPQAVSESERQRVAKDLGKALVLGVAYAANIGGMATLTGTGPNLVLAGQVREPACASACVQRLGVPSNHPLTVPNSLHTSVHNALSPSRGPFMARLAGVWAATRDPRAHDGVGAALVVLPARRSHPL